MAFDPEWSKSQKKNSRTAAKEADRQGVRPRIGTTSEGAGVYCQIHE